MHDNLENSVMYYLFTNYCLPEVAGPDVHLSGQIISNVITSRKNQEPTLACFKDLFRSLFNLVSKCSARVKNAKVVMFGIGQTSKEGIRAHCPSVVGSIDG
jgi:hypothetical protein